MNRVKQLVERTSGLLLPVVLVLVWKIVADSGVVPSLVLPSPGKVLRAFETNFAEQRLLEHITASLKRVLVGFLLGSVAGFSLGLASGLWRTCERIFIPAFHAFRQVPVVGWIPLFVMLLPVAELPQIAVIATAAFFPITMNTFDGVRNVRKEYLELAAVNGYRGFRLVRRIIIPAALPSVMTGLTLSLGISWAIMMAAEFFIDTDTGIGTRINAGRSGFNIALVLVGIITVGVIGFGMSVTLEKIALLLNRGRDFHQEA